ncbi:prepilin-type N-terminal cleavage/methylation domain-containing protein [Aquabacterium sp. OR-4]|uniref:prepilin-type N-terminal cleavage/methylation domain-containing protein n=1 Tax=Aquabacterium sp. OR-4 TaxID=2978127 RepID=UPI0021B47B26|nr:prepilin-type N-terminal cleavage/methylation domain-containing protein [Aquabacterium sp. OR-4]MDT7837594.1 prepilin-type N-terminal cleavage/methylation domain-containing protein [Aquabacterium sp. OR-4]
MAHRPAAALPPVLRPPRRLPAARGRGFTLVEVLVALFIMAVIAGIGWQGIATMARSREVADEATQRTLRLSALVGQWEQDLQAVYDSPLVPGLAFDGGTLRLVRRVDGQGAAGGVQVVAWTLRSEVWRRWAGPVVQRSDALQQAWMASFQLQGPEPGQLRLLDGVSAWQVYFWRGQGWSNAQSTGDLSVVTPPATGASGATATTARTRLPGAVRMQLTLPEGMLTRDVQLAPQQP